METTEANLARPPVVSQNEWDAARTALLERERNVAAAMHELAAARKRMPMVRVEHDYVFEGPDGRRSLPGLFDGRSQLILYRFFFEEGVDGWPDAGCVGCSSVADGIPKLGLLHARDITFAMASRAPQANLRRYAERMGWTDVPWYTIRSERFSADFGVNEWFGFNVFLRDGSDVYRTYFLQHGAMVQWIGSLWSLWSLTPYGGQSNDEDLPEGWPRAPGRKVWGPGGRASRSAPSRSMAAWPGCATAWSTGGHRPALVGTRARRGPRARRPRCRPDRPRAGKRPGANGRNRPGGLTLRRPATPSDVARAILAVSVAAERVGPPARRRGVECR